MQGPRRSPSNDRDGVFDRHALSPNLYLTRMVHKIRRSVRFHIKRLHHRLQLVTRRHTRVPVFNSHTFTTLLGRVIHDITTSLLHRSSTRHFYRRRPLDRVRITHRTLNIRFRPFNSRRHLLRTTQRRTAGLQRNFPFNIPRARTTLIFLQRHTRRYQRRAQRPHHHTSRRHHTS